MGYECAQFTPPIYNDLLQGGDGTAEGMVISYFTRMGWPTMLATSDQPAFIRKVGIQISSWLASVMDENQYNWGNEWWLMAGHMRYIVMGKVDGGIQIQVQSHAKLRSTIISSLPSLKSSTSGLSRENRAAHKSLKSRCSAPASKRQRCKDCGNHRCGL